MSSFKFDRVEKNKKLYGELMIKPPQPYVASVNAAAIAFTGGVLLAVDTRGTKDNNSLDTNINKIFKLTDNVFICGTGVMMDIERTVSFVSGQLAMLKKCTNRQVLHNCAKHMVGMAKIRLHERLVASFLIAGFDKTGLGLYTVYYDGTSESIAFNCLGSQTAPTISILEHGWHEHLAESEAVELALAAINIGNTFPPFTFPVELCIIRADGTIDQGMETVSKTVVDHNVKVDLTKDTTDFGPPDWRDKVIVGRPKVYKLEPESSDSESESPETYDHLKITPAWMDLKSRLNAERRKNKHLYDNKYT